MFYVKQACSCHEDVALIVAKELAVPARFPVNIEIFLVLFEEILHLSIIFEGLTVPTYRLSAFM